MSDKRSIFPTLVTAWMIWPKTCGVAGGVWVRGGVVFSSFNLAALERQGASGNVVSPFFFFYRFSGTGPMPMNHVKPFLTAVVWVKPLRRAVWKPCGAASPKTGVRAAFSFSVQLGCLIQQESFERQAEVQAKPRLQILELNRFARRDKK
jgi:hypothetical protein